jgi:hypothetical protein
MNADILNSRFARSFEVILLGIIEKDCRQIIFREYSRRKTWLSRLADWSSYQMIRFMMRIMFMMTGKTK